MGALSCATIALSADGTKGILRTLAIQDDGEQMPSSLWVSIDTASNFLAAVAPTDVSEVLITADGNKMGAVINGTIYMFQKVAPQVLSVTASASGVLLSWIVPSTPFVLQQSQDLATWTTVTNQSVLNFTNLRYQVELPFTTTQSFYRLKTQ